MMFDIADQRGCANNDILWYAISGVSDIFLRNSISPSNYAQEVAMLKAAQERFNPNSVQKARSEAVVSTAISGAEGAIAYENEAKFVHLRHWTLYNSLLHAPFVMSRMSVWRERGRKELELLFAKMGFPLNQCRCDYSAMDLEYRELLTIQLDKFSQEFGLRDYEYPSFVRDIGYVMKVSASDTVMALRAILESPNMISFSKTFTASNDLEVWKSNFFFAFDALD